MKEQQAEALRAQSSVFQQEIAKQKDEIQRLCDHENDYKQYAEFELNVKDAIILTYKTRLELLQGNAKKMKAVLRVPRLTKQYHDMTRDHHLPEFDSIEKIYDRHY